MRVGIVALFVFVFLVFSSRPAMARGCSGNHSTHGIFCPKSGLSPFGVAYNPVSEDWSWYVGAKTVFFHPARFVWVGGVGLGVSLDQFKHRGVTPVFTFVPLMIDGFAVETSISRIPSISPTGEHKKSRLIIISWNWTF